MKIIVHTHIADIPAQCWNRLLKDNNPFLRHEFLLALEQNNCVSKVFGWLPRHITLYEDDMLMAAMPLYEKDNSYGEFVFDHAWAEAYQQASLTYFPKLVSADHNEQCIAGSLMFCSDTTLYGRHWGCTEYIDKLHPTSAPFI